MVGRDAAVRLPDVEEVDDESRMGDHIEIEARDIGPAYTAHSPVLPRAATAVPDAAAEG